MKRVCLFLLISICSIGYGQKADSLNKKGLQRKLIPDAATAEKISKYKESVTLDKQKARQKRNAIIRIGIGGALVVVMVIGLSRRKKIS